MRTQRIAFRWGAALACALGAPISRAAETARPEAGSYQSQSESTKVGPARGTLLIVGGGSMAKLWSVFLELAGGKDAPIVVIPTANEPIEPEKSAVQLRSLGALDVH